MCAIDVRERFAHWLLGVRVLAFGKSHIVLKRLDLSKFTKEEQKEIMNDIGAKNISELKDVIKEAINFCNFAATKDAPYTSMVRNNYSSLPQKG